MHYGIEINIHTQVRAKYHYAIRYVRKNKDHICSEKLAKAPADGDQQRFLAGSGEGKTQGKKYSMRKREDQRRRYVKCLWRKVQVASQFCRTRCRRKIMTQKYVRAVYDEGVTNRTEYP